MLKKRIVSFSIMLLLTLNIVLAWPKDKLVFIPGLDFVDDTNFLHIMGAVENKTGEWICNVLIFFKLFDTSGANLNVLSTTGERQQVAVCANYVIPPNGKAYFHFIRDLSKVKAKYKNYQVEEIRYLKAPNNLSAEVKIAKVEQGFDNFRVKGTYLNTGKATIKNPVVVMVGFDDKGKIIMVDSSGLIDIDKMDLEVPFLNPRQSSTFNTIFTPDHNLKIARFILIPGYSPQD